MATYLIFLQNNNRILKSTAKRQKFCTGNCFLVSKIESEKKPDKYEDRMDFVAKSNFEKLIIDLKLSFNYWSLENVSKLTWLNIYKLCINNFFLLVYLFLISIRSIYNSYRQRNIFSSRFFAADTSWYSKCFQPKIVKIWSG